MIRIGASFSNARAIVKRCASLNKIVAARTNYLVEGSGQFGEQQTETSSLGCRANLAFGCRRFANRDVSTNT